MNMDAYLHMQVLLEGTNLYLARVGLIPLGTGSKGPVSISTVTASLKLSLGGGSSGRFLSPCWNWRSSKQASSSPEK